MRSNHFPSVALLITATIWAAFALWLGSSPAALLEAFGIAQSSPQMLTEIRAFYGGVELGIAAAMVALWWQGEVVAGLLVGGLPLVGSAAGRGVGLVTDGYSGLHAAFAGFELLGAAFCFAGAYVAGRASGVDAGQAPSADTP